MVTIKLENEEAEVLRMFLRGRLPGLMASARAMGFASGNADAHIAGNIVQACGAMPKGTEERGQEELELEGGEEDEADEEKKDDKTSAVTSTPPPYRNTFEGQAQVGAENKGEDYKFYLLKDMPPETELQPTLSWRLGGKIEGFPQDPPPVKLVCAEGHQFILGGHNITADGKINEKVICPVASCYLAGFIALEDWEFGDWPSGYEPEAPLTARQGLTTSDDLKGQ